MAAVALGLSLQAVPSAGAAATHHDRSGMAIARASLITGRDFGSGWSSSPAPRKVPTLTCPAFDPGFGKAVETGAAASRRYQNGDAGPFVSESTHVFATPVQAAGVASRVMRPGLIRCVRSSLTSGSGQGVTYEVSRAHALSVPELGARDAGYRAAGTASQTYQIVNVYLDLVVIQSGQTVTELSFASFLEAPAAGVEHRLARLVAQRIAPRHG